ncbi:GNAT family N-acetyltransferase [Paenibacillus sp. NRS-1760]|uniref:GNAT family N-acetyltransferase n=1 Tax=Paenibacillus sp. NRS-1760 TaxID=3233902 RepID=UPI003D266C7A
MLAQYRVCKNDADLAQYALYFIRHRTDFSSKFSLPDSLYHILQSLQQSKVMLILSLEGDTIGWAHYRYLSTEYEPVREGEIAFVDSVIINDAYRSGRLFINGFRFLANHIAAENPKVRTFEFHALASHAYLNRLYSKFATIVGQRDGYHEIENAYSTDFNQLLHYLNRTKNDN